MAKEIRGFTEGLNTNVAPFLSPKGAYSFCLNLQFLSMDGKDGELVAYKGNQRVANVDYWTARLPAGSGYEETGPPIGPGPVLTDPGGPIIETPPPVVGPPGPISNPFGDVITQF